jgi:hypothetical protein
VLKLKNKINHKNEKKQIKNSNQKNKKQIG